MLYCSLLGHVNNFGNYFYKEDLLA